MIYLCSDITHVVGVRGGPACGGNSTHDTKCAMSVKAERKTFGSKVPDAMCVDHIGELGLRILLM